MKKRLSLVLALILMSVSVFAERGKVTVLFTNDVHTYIANTVKDAEGNKVPGLSYGSIVALRDDLKAQGENVALIDAGDHVQGTAYGSMDEGAHIVKFMNAAKYDCAAIGNHEFDYGTDRLMKIIKEAKYPYVACNFRYTKNNKTVVNPYTIVKFGNTKVAFVGIMTPETYTKSVPAYFMDKAQKNFVLKIDGGDDGKALYESVQATVDEAAKKADYVVVIGHLGDDLTASPWTSEEVIANTKGYEAFIDGHSHSTVPMEIVKNADGKDVVLTQTGSYFGAIGVLTLNDTEVSSQLLTSYGRSDEKIDAMVKEWADQVDAQLNKTIAVSDVPLYISEPENSKARLIRKQETNLGDLVPDAAYWYFNEVEGLECDLAISNGGGIRANLPSGDYTYNSAKTVQPFGNIMCLVELSGQEVLDALEFGARDVGKGECGGFLQVAGIKYTIDSSIPSTVQIDNGLWVKGPETYRVTEVKVYNRTTGEWDDLDLTKTYRMAGVNYTLRNSGDGYSMLASTKLVKDYVLEDYLMASAYVKAFAKGADGVPHIASANSPLKAYANYPIDYENPNGSGRITIK